MQQERQTELRRALNLPMLIFYGVGVTVGAGIFALIGETMLVAGEKAPLSFVVAGIIAAATGLSYAKLAAVYPRAAGEAIFVNIGIGPQWGRIVGIGVTLTAIISSAAVALSFAGYLGQLISLPPALLTVGLITILCGVACLGVKESVIFAAIVTAIELITLLAIIFFGAPQLTNLDTWVAGLAPPTQLTMWPVIFSASMLAFFAFIGFEDIENMAEETIDASKNVPRAIIATLIITIIIYTLIALIAISAPNLDLIAHSKAPLANLYGQLTLSDSNWIAGAATIAMVNGILVHMMMAARVIFGMGKEGLLPPFFSKLHPTRQTPIRATILVAAAIAALSVSFPLSELARTTSAVVLFVFTLVNFSLWRIGNQPKADPSLKSGRWLGLFGAILSSGLLVNETINMMS